MNDIQLSSDYQRLMNRLNHLDLIDPFHDDYYAEMQAINLQFSFLKAQSERPLLLPSVKPQVLSLSIYTSHDEMIDLMDSLTQMYAKNAQSADDFETVIYSNINNYDFKGMNIMVKAQVDFLDLYFEIENFSTRHDIKKYLTEKTGITHYISEHKKGFIIRLRCSMSHKGLCYDNAVMERFFLNLKMERVDLNKITEVSLFVCLILLDHYRVILSIDWLIPIVS